MIDMVHKALCCWTSQPSPIEETPSSPDSPCSAQSECTCAHVLDTNEMCAVTASMTINGSKTKSIRTQSRHAHCCYHHRLALEHLHAARDEKRAHARTLLSLPQSSKQHKKCIPPTSMTSTRTWPRTSHVMDVLSKKTSPSALDVVSPYHSTTFMLTPPSAYANSGLSHHTSPGKSPSKRFSLQKYYYGRNTMRMTPPRTPSPPPQSSAASSPKAMPASLPSPSSSLPSPVLASASLPASRSILATYPSQSPTLSPVSVSAVAPTTISEQTASTSGHEGTTTDSVVSMPGSDAGSLSIQTTQSNNDLFATEIASSSSAALPALRTPSPAFSLRLDMSSTSRNLPPPTLTTSLATPTSPSLPTLPLPCSPSVDSSLAISAQPYPSPLSSPSLGPVIFTSRASGITSPEKSDATPFPASSISSAGLARLLEESKQGSVSAGSRRPLILDLRPHPEFYPVSIRSSININLPTLLVRRYRRGGAVSSFALESFITMPSDMDMYHQIQDSWGNNAGSSDKPCDVIVLDQDMKAGKEEYGRSATAAWTLLNVLERGIGSHCFGGAPIRLWYLEGGFEAFQAWDASEEYLVRPGSTPSIETQDRDVEMTAAPPVEETQAAKPSLTINTSVSSTPKPKAVRRESLFSLNTKSLQRPTGLPRSGTPSLKPLSIPSANGSNPASPYPQQSKASWLMVPSPIGAAVSPTMSVVSNHSMELSHSASTDHSSWSAGPSSVNGSSHFPLLAPPRLTLSTTPSTPVSQRDGDDGCPTSAYSSLSLHVPHSADACSDHTKDEDENQDDGEQEISCILPNFLYLGPEIVNEAQVAELDRLGVKRILNMATECEDLLVANRQGMEYHKIGVYDHIDADVSAGLLQAVDIIAASSDSPIYVHCKAGKSRSVTATIAYLITQLHWPLNKAYQHVLKQRPCMCPNIGFVTELMRVEERTLGKVTGLYA